jgi:hypothetical protein
MMRTTTMRVFVAATLLLAAACLALGCHPSEKDIARMNEALAAIAPFKARLAKMHQALPARGSEKSIACEGSIPAEGLETVNLKQLEQLLDKGEADYWERHRLTSGPFFKMYSEAQAKRILEEDPAPAGAIGNMRMATEELAKTKHVVVFRADEIDKGKVGARKSDGYSIEREASWKGWVFVFSFTDEPKLAAAFEARATNGKEIHFMKKRGKRPSGEILIGDAVKRLKKGALARLEKPGCPEILSRNQQWERDCAQKHDGEACWNIARLYKSGVDYKKDEAKALSYFERACDAEEPHAKACFESGYAHATAALGATKDKSKAAKRYRRACTAGSMVACNNLGVLTGKGDGVDKDVAQSAELYQRACDGAYALACNNLASYYARGTGVDKDPDKARALKAKACSLGHKKACAR